MSNKLSFERPSASTNKPANNLCCDTVLDLIESISRQMCDQEDGYEYNVVSKEDLLGYYNCAQKVIWNAQRDMYSSTVQISVDPGDAYPDFPGVGQILSVESVSVDGVVSTPSEQDDEDSAQLNALSKWFTCVPLKKGAVDTYSISASGTSIRLNPAPPCDAESIEVTMKVTAPPPNVCAGDEANSKVDPTKHGMLYELMMYYSLGGNAETTDQVNIANQHLEAFLVIAGIDYRAFDRIRAQSEDPSQAWRFRIRGVNR